MDIYLESPSGTRIGPLYENLGPQRHRTGNTELLIYYGKPGPYHVTQEIYFDFIPTGNYVDSGVWKIILSGRNIKDGGRICGGNRNFFCSAFCQWGCRAFDAVGHCGWE